MSSSRKYKCVFCNKTFVRNKLSIHIEKEHEEMLNPDKGYTANRIVFDTCNKKEPIGGGHSLCRICKKPTEWNENLVRYEAYCSEKCKSEARERAKQNMIKVYGKPTLLDDIEWQNNNMLSNRKISGKYKWSDGTYKTYVGSYEKKFLEFCDIVLQIKSSDLVTPGPTIEYEFDGKKHEWITDALYLPYNLVFDIKDGGNNKNNREMPEYRAKQIAKETFITEQGKYSYIRLTNNQFDQLLLIFSELKELYLDDNELHTISRINEHMAIGGINPMISTVQPTQLFITNYQKKKTEEIMNSLREEVNKNFKPIHNAINLDNFKIGNKKVSASKVINEINHTAIECADGVLYEEGKCVRMSALSALEIEKLDPNRRSNSNRNQIMIDRIRMIYDHIIDDEKPNSFILWTKQTGISSINDYFFTLYNATFGRSNIVTYTCNKCDNVFMQTKNINDMIKFRNDDVKNKYYEILHTGIRKLDDPKIELFQISDNYVAALRKPTLYEIFMEPSYINKEFSDKYEDLLLLISYISDIYQIDRVNGELLKIDTKPMATDKTLTTKRKIKIYSTILKTLTSDQITALSLKTNDFDDGVTDDDGNTIPNISYQYPSTECPKCGNKIDAIDERPDSMVFTRHQLGLLSKI